MLCYLGVGFLCLSLFRIRNSLRKSDHERRRSMPPCVALEALGKFGLQTKQLHLQQFPLACRPAFVFKSVSLFESQECGIWFAYQSVNTLVYKPRAWSANRPCLQISSHINLSIQSGALHPAALSFVSYGVVLVRVRVSSKSGASSDVRPDNRHIYSPINGPI